MYCHCCNILQDFYSTLLYVIVLDKNIDIDYILPSIAYKVLRIDNTRNNVVDSRDSEIFTAILQVYDQ